MMGLSQAPLRKCQTKRASISSGPIFGLALSNVNPTPLNARTAYGVKDFLTAQSVRECRGLRDLRAVFAQSLNRFAGQMVKGARPDVVRKYGNFERAITQGQVLK